MCFQTIASKPVQIVFFLVEFYAESGNYMRLRRRWNIFSFLVMPAQVLASAYYLQLDDGRFVLITFF